MPAKQAFYLLSHTSNFKFLTFLTSVLVNTTMTEKQ
jgi:hypothetical protein